MHRSSGMCVKQRDALSNCGVDVLVYKNIKRGLDSFESSLQLQEFKIPQFNTT
jgi:hypothetical protein